MAENETALIYVVFFLSVYHASILFFRFVSLGSVQELKGSFTQI